MKDLVSDYMGDFEKNISGFKEMSFEERLSAVVKKSASRTYSKVALKVLFRLKPAPNATPDKSFKNHFGKDVSLYCPARCVKMRAVVTKKRSEAQEKVAKDLAKKSKMRSKKGRASETAWSFLQKDIVVIDTETTDLDGVVIQIAAKTLRSQKVLIDTFVHTDKKICTEAYGVHHISADMLKGKPNFDEVFRKLIQLLGDREWTAFNIKFDLSVMKRSLSPESLKLFKDFQEKKAPCAMYLSADFFGATNARGSISLDTCRGYLSLSDQKAHSALGDVDDTCSVLRHISQYYEDMS